MLLWHKMNINSPHRAAQGSPRPLLKQGRRWGLGPLALALVVAACFSVAAEASPSPQSQAKQENKQSEQEQDPTDPSLEAEALTEDGSVPIESKVDPNSGYRVPDKEKKSDKTDNNGNNGSNGGKGGKASPNSDGEQKSGAEGASVDGSDSNRRNKQKRVQQSASNSSDDASTSPKNGAKQNKGSNGKNQTSGPASQGPGGPKGDRLGQKGKSSGTQGQKQKGQGEPETAKGGQDNGVKQDKVDKVGKGGKTNKNAAQTKKQKPQHDAAYYYRLGKRAIQNERIKKGIGYLNKSWQLDSSKDNVRTAKLMARTYGRYQAQEQALTWYSRVLEREPTFFPAHLYRAEAKDTLKAWRAALQSLDHKDNLPYEPQRGQIHLEIGRLWQKKNKPTKAQSHWQKALQSPKSRHQAQWLLGRLHFHSGEHQAARHYLQKYEKWRQGQEPQDWPIKEQKKLYDMLLALAKQKNTAPDPGNRSPQDSDKGANAKQRQSREKTRIYQKFLELDHRVTEAYDYLAAQAYRHKKWPELLQRLQDKKNRGLELSRKQREFKAEAHAKLTPHEKNKSLEIYAALEQDYPQDSTYLRRQARLFRELGYELDAVKKYHKLYDKTGGDKESLAYLFDWHRKQRQWRQALLYGGKLLLSLKPDSKEAESVRRKLCNVHLNRARAAAPAIFAHKPQKQSGKDNNQDSKANKTHTSSQNPSNQQKKSPKKKTQTKQASQADIQKKNSNQQQALKQIHQCLKLEPDNKQAHTMQKLAARYGADAAWARQDYDRAASLYDSYLDTYPDDGKAAQRRRQALKRHALGAYDKEDYPTAIRRLKRYLKDYPAADPARNSGQTQASSGQKPHKDSGELQKKLYLAHLRLGHQRYEESNYQKAIDHLQTWLKQARSDKSQTQQKNKKIRQQRTQARLTVAAAQHKLGRFLKERDSLTKVLEQEPGHREALEALVYIYWRKIHNPPKLKRYSRRLLRSHPDHPRKGFYRALAESR